MQKHSAKVPAKVARVTALITVRKNINSEIMLLCYFLCYAPYDLAVDTLAEAFDVALDERVCR